MRLERGGQPLGGKAKGKERDAVLGSRQWGFGEGKLFFGFVVHIDC